jgi:hypothetical protein
MNNHEKELFVNAAFASARVELLALLSKPNAELRAEQIAQRCAAMIMACGSIQAINLGK